MTDLAMPVSAESTRTHPRSVPILAVGLFGGAGLGIVARVWMRLISDHLEFSWNGTLFIVFGFTIFGFSQSIVAVARRRARRRWPLRIARVIGIIGLLPLFVGAGAQMMPTVVGGGLLLARQEWRRSVRVICLVFAVAPVVLVGSQLIGKFGLSPHTAVGFVAMVLIYAAIVSATRFTFAAQPGGRQINTKLKVVLIVIVVLAVAQFIVGFLTA
jgi:hypothetical protein